MLLDRDQAVMEETSLGVLLPPPLNAARGIVIGVTLSAVLWGMILAAAWLLA